MPSVAGSKKLKRQMAPMFWGISRKKPRFVTTVRPGPHAKAVSVPTQVLLRDILKIVTTRGSLRNLQRQGQSRWRTKKIDPSWYWIDGCN
jgi:ribosomal protein S4E